MSDNPKIIDGKALAEEIKLEVRREIVEKKLEPHLAVILVGDDTASQLYVKMKEAACKLVGIQFHKYFLPATASAQELHDTIDWLNQDKMIDAILIQMPLPAQFDETEVIARLDPVKDVDGFTPTNIQLLLTNQPRIVPGLVLGVIKLLEATKEDLTNKQSLVIAKSPIFTEPLAYLLEQISSGVTVIEPDNPQIKEACLQADIVVTAAGKQKLITAEMIKPEAIVIDIGINKNAEGKTVGDVDFPEVEPLVSHITPVPGGVGPMTVAMLLYNTVILAQK